MKKTIRILFIVIFILLCLAPIVGFSLGYKGANVEKRANEKLPSIISEGKVNIDFTKEFDTYFTQNFAFRNDFITLYARLNSTIFKKSVSEKVIVGKNGWLFFNSTIDDYKRQNLLTNNQIYRIYKTLYIQKIYLDEKDIDLIFTVAPNKSSIYPEYMPSRFVVSDSLSNVEMLFKELGKNQFEFVNLHDSLLNNDKIVYHKLDTHWNNYGAMIAYNKILKAVGDKNELFTYKEYKNIIAKATKTWSGDLGDMLYPTAGMLDMQYDYDLRKDYSTKRPIKSYEDMMIETSSESGVLNLYMFRDSFANALIPIMSNEFSNVRYTRATPYDYSDINSGNTDTVVLEIVERNLPNLIKKAPLLIAPTIDFDFDIAVEDITSEVVILENDDSITICGYAIPTGYDKDVNYDIYIILDDGLKKCCYLPFPILDNELFEDVESYANVAFSMMIDKEALPKGSYNIDVVISDSNGYAYKTMDTVNSN